MSWGQARGGGSAPAVRAGRTRALRLKLMSGSEHVVNAIEPKNGARSRSGVMMIRRTPW